jgi:chemotaxis protein MotB
VARKKTEEAPAGAPAWMATFSDLMNLLLCFFVLLFSMSTVDAEKFEMVIASLQSSFSILPSGGASIGDGEMVSSGVSQLQMYDIYYNQMANTQTTDDTSESSDVASASCRRTACLRKCFTAEKSVSGMNFMCSTERQSSR